MTDTVLIALITFISGLSGALIGAISTWKASTHSSRSEIRKHLRNEKIVAYSDYLSTYFKFFLVFSNTLTSFEDVDFNKADILYALGSAYSKACIVATPKTQEALRTLTDLCLNCITGDPPGSQVSSAFNALISCMREELQISE